MEEVCGGGRLSCRFTHVYVDGPAPYYTFVAKGVQGGEIEQWGEIKHAASEAVLDAGGTITHHHAVGRMHRPQYDRQRPDLFAQAFVAAKRVVDPHRTAQPGGPCGRRLSQALVTGCRSDFKRTTPGPNSASNAA